MHSRQTRWLHLFAVAVVMLPALASGQQFGTEQLDQLTAPIALYPDALLSQVLMASTYPADVAEAAQWSRAHAEQKGDAAVQMVEDEPWDPSVQSLVAFPQVIIMMGEKPDWVQDLGDAFLAQPEDVMDSVQRLRAQAQKAGNLTSNEQMVVKVEQAPPPEPQTVVVQQSAPPPQVIVIEPAQPEVIYVPQYNPTVVYGAWPYPSYPPYYIPPPPGYWFSNVVGGAIATGIAWGVGVGISNAIWGGFDWHHHDVNINVNRYNNININRRLDVNSNRANWRHDVNHRRGVPYRGGNATRDHLQRKYQSTSREQFRGRDSSRERAQQTLRDRGVSHDRGPLSDANRERAQQAQSRDRSASRDRAQNVNRDTRQRAQNVDRDARHSRAQSMKRDNALSGVNDRQARPQVERGNASRQAMQQHSRPQPQRAAASAKTGRSSSGGSRGGKRHH